MPNHSAGSQRRSTASWKSRRYAATGTTDRTCSYTCGRAYAASEAMAMQRVLVIAATSAASPTASRTTTDDGVQNFCA